LAGVEDAGLDAAQGAEHPAMLAPDLPQEMIPLAGDHMEDFLQTCRARDAIIRITECNILTILSVLLCCSVGGAWDLFIDT